MEELTKKQKQQRKILDYLMTGATMTSIECFDKLRITKLSTRIGELKRKGYNIDDRWESSIDEDGMPTRYKRYWLV